MPFISEQPQQTRARILLVDTADVGGAPTDRSTDQPHFALSPTTPWGETVEGFALGLKAPALATPAAAASAGFTVTVWVRDPATWCWFPFASKTGVGLGDLYGTFDIGPAELRIQLGAVTTPGLVELHLFEE